MKGHKKANKGNSEKSFVYRDYGTLRARVCEKKKCLSERQVRCVGVCVCVLANYLDRPKIKCKKMQRIG